MRTGGLYSIGAAPGCCCTWARSRRALGRGGRAFIDWLAEAGFTVWQILPLGPDRRRWLAVLGPLRLRRQRGVRRSRRNCPIRAAATIESFLDGRAALARRLRAVRGAEQRARRRAVVDLARGAARSRSAAPSRARARAARARSERVKREQFAFAVQWRRLREHAHHRGVRLVRRSAVLCRARFRGDLGASRPVPARCRRPADGRGRRAARLLLRDRPAVGQSALRLARRCVSDGFTFWRARVRQQLERVDLLRIDHFRALAAHWAVPAGAPDARSRRVAAHAGRRAAAAAAGRVRRPADRRGGSRRHHARMSRRCADDFGLPGMRVLQFAFGGDGDNPHLPHMHERDSVVYTGTHDNDTSSAGITALDERDAPAGELFLRFTPGSHAGRADSRGARFGRPARDHPRAGRAALGSEARLNTPVRPPGTGAGGCRRRADAELARHFAMLNRMYGRA